MAGLTVVGVDGSDGSRVALRWAGALAAARQDRLRVVATWAYPKLAALPFGPELRGREEMDELTRTATEQVVTDALGPEAAVSIDVYRGAAGPTIVRAAGELGADLTVLGRRGLGGFEGLLLGSVTRHVVQHAPGPVAVVPGDLADDTVAPRRIAVGVDGSETGTVALEWARDLARATGGTVLALHAFVPIQAEIPPETFAELRAEDAASLRDKWCAPLRDAGVEHEAVTVDGDPRVALPEEAAERGADVLVLGTRGLGGFRRLLLGSVAQHVVQVATVPVVLVPPR